MEELKARSGEQRISIEGYRKAAEVFYFNSSGCRPSQATLDALAEHLQYLPSQPESQHSGDSPDDCPVCKQPESPAAPHAGHTPWPGYCEKCAAAPESLSDERDGAENAPVSVGPLRDSMRCLLKPLRHGEMS